jgi:hypothetical protein
MSTPSPKPVTRGTGAGRSYRARIGCLAARRALGLVSCAICNACAMAWHLAIGNAQCEIIHNAYCIMHHSGDMWRGRGRFSVSGFRFPVSGFRVSGSRRRRRPRWRPPPLLPTRCAIAGQNTKHDILARLYWIKQCCRTAQSDEAFQSPRAI